MEIRPQNIKEVWTEKELAERLGLPINPATGRSKILGNWVRGGLKCAEKSGRRFYSEADIINYLCQSRDEG